MRKINKILGFELTKDQLEAIHLIGNFIDDKDKDVFILKGSAGTGKTSIVKAVLHQLQEKKINFQTLAPTGRASNIISEKTDSISKTVHSAIYYPINEEDGSIRLTIKRNNNKNFTVFIVDESSMISDKENNDYSFKADKSLLFDLIKYVKEGNEKNKIIFVGDKFQLPPVKQDFSPALCANYLNKVYNMNCSDFELTTVMRQSEGSNILDLATSVRNSIINKKVNITNFNIETSKGSSSIIKPYLENYCSDNQSNIIMICSTNKDVNIWNNIFRQRLGYGNEILVKGDSIVTQSTLIDKKGNFQHKGSFGKIESFCSKVREYAGLYFIDCEIKFNVNGEEKKIVKKVLVNSLLSNSGKLTFEEEKRLFAEAMKHNHVFRKTRNSVDDEFVGALRIRHSYAITCHKAQGGEWDSVIIHPRRLAKDLQWTYTALTRARNEVKTYS